MNQQCDLPEPPRVAEWLTALFVPADIAESVTGDLQEEFSNLLISWGAPRARSWYWRQAAGITLRAGPAAFRSAPLRMFMTVVAGLWLIGFATRYSTHAMQTLLDARRLYEVNPDAYLFWLKFPLEVGRLAICAAVGSLAALAAKRHEMPVALTVALAQLAMFCAGTIALIAHGRHWVAWFIAMIPWNVLSAIATTAGAVIVRICRGLTSSRTSAASAG